MKPETVIKFRLSLIAFTLIALLGFGFWRQFYRERPITEGGPESVQLGMTEFQVRWLLGAPHRKYTTGPDSWGYDLHGQDRFYLHVIFDDGRVKSVMFDYKTESGIPPFDVDRTNPPAGEC